MRTQIKLLFSILFLSSVLAFNLCISNDQVSPAVNEKNNHERITISPKAMDSDEYTADVTERFYTSWELHSDGYYHQSTSRTAKVRFTFTNNTENWTVSVDYFDIGEGTETYSSRIIIEDIIQGTNTTQEMNQTTDFTLNNIDNKNFYLNMSWSYQFSACLVGQATSQYCTDPTTSTKSGTQQSLVSTLGPLPLEVDFFYREQDQVEMLCFNFTDPNFNLYGDEHRDNIYVNWQAGNHTTDFVPEWFIGTWDVFDDCGSLEGCTSLADDLNETYYGIFLSDMQQPYGHYNMSDPIITFGFSIKNLWGFHSNYTTIVIDVENIEQYALPSENGGSIGIDNIGYLVFYLGVVSSILVYRNKTKYTNN